MTTFGTLLDFPGPVPETIVVFLRPASRKLFRLTCKEARQLVDRTVESATVDIGNVRILCGPWRPLHTTFPRLRHLNVCLRSTGAVTWDVPQMPANIMAVQAGGVAATITAAASGARGRDRTPSGPAAAAAGFSFRLLRNSVPLLAHLRSLDLTQCFIDPTVWSALCDKGGALPRGLELRLHPAAALLFPGRTWAERLAVMIAQLAAVQPDVRIRVVACSGGGSTLGGGGSSSNGSGGAACWCDVDGKIGLRKLAELHYVCELPVCVWSRAPCQPSWLFPLSGLTRLHCLHISCCNAADPRDHAWLGGLSALAALRELDISRTDSPFMLADLAHLSACAALTALSVGSLTAAGPPGAGAMQAVPLPPPRRSDEDGRADNAAVLPLPQIRRLVVRGCLLGGPLPLGELVPGAVSVSMCALTIGGVVGGGGGRGNGLNGYGDHILWGHVLQSLMAPGSAFCPAGGASLLPPSPLARLLSIHRLFSHHRLHQFQHQPQSQPTGSLLPPPFSAPLGAAAAQLRCGLRSLELSQRETAAITFGPAMEGTGRSPLPDTALLGELKALEHLQFTGWRFPGGQLPALLAAAQRLPRLRRLTLRGCGAQYFGWGTSGAAANLACGLGLRLRPLEGLTGGLQLQSLEALEVLGAPSLLLLKQLALACRMPQLSRLELHGVQCWDERDFRIILGTATRAAVVNPPMAVPESRVARRVAFAAASASNSAGGSNHGGDGNDGLPLMFRFFKMLAAAAHAAKAPGPSHCGWCNRRCCAIHPCELRPPTTAGGTSEVVNRGNRSCGGEAGPGTCESSRCGGPTREPATGVHDKPVGITCSRSESGSGCVTVACGCSASKEPRSLNRRWPRLSYIAVHGCPDTTLEALKRQAAVAGMRPWVEVNWLVNSQALVHPARGRRDWADSDRSEPDDVGDT